MAVKVIRKLRLLFDVTFGAPNDGDVLTYDQATDKFVLAPPAGGGGGGAPTTADYLVGTADAGLSNEIVVGPSPGGELGGTWPAPTVDAVHSGSSHAQVQAAAEATAAAALAASEAGQVRDGDAAGGVLSGTYPNPGFAVDMATQAELDAHVNDPADAHDAAAVSYQGATGIAATDVEGALDELAAEKANAADAVMDGDAAGGVLAGTYPNPSFAADMATQAELDAHVNDGSAAHPASAVSVDSTTLSGTGTDVQASLEELDNLLDDHSARHENGGADEISIAGLDGVPTALQDHLDDPADAHDAAAISVADAGGYFDSTEAEAVLQEIGAQLNVGKIWLSAAGMWPSTTNGCAANAKTEYATNDVDMYGLAFDQTTQEHAQATVAMPDDWDGGTITAKFYWTKVGTSQSGVVWECAGRSYGDLEDIDAAWGTAQEIADTGSASTNQVHISGETPAITLAGTPVAGEMVQLRVSRDPANGNDTLAADAILLGVMLHYTRAT